MSTIALLHISDLHIGPKILNNQFGWIKGYHEHDILLCEGLARATKELTTRLKYATDGKFHTVVSGDLSATGLDTEFAVAHTMLRGQFRRHILGTKQFVGLNLSEEYIVQVAGNHDHWGGRHLGYNALLANTHFPGSPWYKSWRSGPLSVEIYGVDSNSPLVGRVGSRLAKGIISKASLTDLEISLSTPRTENVHVVKAVVVHHSLCYTKGALPRVASPLALDASSKNALLSLCAKYGVTALLTGHTHDFCKYPHNTRLTGTNCKTWELRCSTTLQGPAANTGAGFLLHRVSLDEHALPRWNAWRFIWSGTRFKQFDDTATPWLDIACA